ncbi:MAG: hypothetical protein A2234_02845 [Elusimicrobia bacterium RIFOXYA2_FULL_58_8]|nr:MAG: hypothetical protein A2234_02845 [Elusimicrobia bacterium RIFOXYA2_FULL_58_8]OGS14436.1 MAG: hypothetical protein A2285_07940 [Elusimicrobia bacterium RIFOXYA12_FULL_57_11]
MNFTEFSGITTAKINALKARVARLGIDLRLVDEHFIRGSGHGGQKLNKTSSTVQLNYPQLGLVVRCQRERKRSLNRFLALRELVDEIELRVSPGTSRKLAEIGKIRRRKARSAAKRSRHAA